MLHYIKSMITSIISLVMVNYGIFQDKFSLDSFLPYVDVQQYTSPQPVKKVRSGAGFSVGGYWEPWHTATKPGDGTTSDPSYYENDFKNLDSVYYAFLTLDGSPDPDAPHEIYWDDSCIYDVETKDCAT